MSTSEGFDMIEIKNEPFSYDVKNETSDVEASSVEWLQESLEGVDDTQLRFVRILRNHPDILNNSQLPAVRERKDAALKQMAMEFEKLTGVEMLGKQVLKKINNMKMRVKTKILSSPDKLHAWEKEFADLIAKTYNPRISQPGVTTASYCAQLFDTCQLEAENQLLENEMELEEPTNGIIIPEEESAADFISEHTQQLSQKKKNADKSSEEKAQEQFVSVLMHHPVLLDNSHAPVVREQKEKALRLFQVEYERKTGHFITEKQILKKLYNMNSKVKTKIYLRASGNNCTRNIKFQQCELVFAKMLNRAKKKAHAIAASSEALLPYETNGHCLNNESDSQMLAEEAFILQDNAVTDMDYISSNHESSLECSQDTADARLKFVMILKKYPVIFSKSQIPAVKEEKDKALNCCRVEYEAATGKSITKMQLCKKINNMKERVKNKMHLTASCSTIKVKPWELMFHKLMSKHKKLEQETSTSQHTNYVQNVDTIGNDLLALLEIPAHSITEAPTQFTSTQEPEIPAQDSSTEPSKLSTQELQRVVLTEQLKLITLQMEYYSRKMRKLDNK